MWIPIGGQPHGQHGLKREEECTLCYSSPSRLCSFVPCFCSIDIVGVRMYCASAVLAHPPSLALYSTLSCSDVSQYLQDVC